MTKKKELAIEKVLIPNLIWSKEKSSWRQL